LENLVNITSLFVGDGVDLFLDTADLVQYLDIRKTILLETTHVNEKTSKNGKKRKENELKQKTFL
tara:strand:- start:2265 stop:2459 length:195 start_codon:yes stop_codon:yes gene_type:complete